jgi:hypothetical protein
VNKERTSIVNKVAEFSGKVTPNIFGFLDRKYWLFGLKIDAS